MKRCGECGWPNNPDDASTCEKCGAPLEGEATPPLTPQTPPPATGGGDGKKTVIGGGHNIPSWDAQPPATPPASSAEDSEILKCESCGFYPLRAPLSPTNPCPNCGTTGANQEPSPQPASSSNADLKKTQMFGEISFDDGKPKRFKLVENNKEAREFEGDSVSIGREDIDPQNFSISGQHATIEMIDGQWHISNHSSNGFTFVQAKGQVPLNNGDIIVIGNKIFQFRSESE